MEIKSQIRAGGEDDSELENRAGPLVVIRRSE